jgi:hypothetical protein
MHELRFAGDALKDLLRTVGGSLRSGAVAQDQEAVRKIRAALERCENEIREIVSSSTVAREAANASAERPESPTGEDYV